MKCYISWIFWKETEGNHSNLSLHDADLCGRLYGYCRSIKQRLRNNKNKPQEEYEHDQQGSRLGEWKAEKDDMTTSSTHSLFPQRQKQTQTKPRQYLRGRVHFLRG